MSKLKDIKSNMVISDDSLVYFLIIVFIMLSVAGFFYWKSIKSKRNNNRKNAIKKLQKLNFSNSKTTAYDFKKYAELLCTSDNKIQFNQINSELEKYKYKKHVADLDVALIQKIKRFIDV